MLHHFFLFKSLFNELDKYIPNIARYSAYERLNLNFRSYQVSPSRQTLQGRKVKHAVSFCLLTSHPCHVAKIPFRRTLLREIHILKNVDIKFESFPVLSSLTSVIIWVVINVRFFNYMFVIFRAGFLRQSQVKIGSKYQPMVNFV